MHIFKVFKYNSNCCIFITEKVILFFNFKKNKIVKEINIQSYKSNYIDFILVNKYYIVGLLENEIFVYNLISDNIYRYIETNHLLSFEKIFNVYKNYFFIKNKTNYYLLFKVKFNGITFIKKYDFYKIYNGNNEDKLDYLCFHDNYIILLQRTF